MNATTHSSTTDPDARLFRKGAGKEAKLCHMGRYRSRLIGDPIDSGPVDDWIGGGRTCKSNSFKIASACFIANPCLSQLCLALQSYV
jgi:hypothetical protein